MQTNYMAQFPQMLSLRSVEELKLYMMAEMETLSASMVTMRTPLQVDRMIRPIIKNLIEYLFSMLKKTEINEFITEYNEIF